MPKVWSIIKRQGGFSPVEVLLAATIFGILAMALTGALVYGQTSTSNIGERTRATVLAEEGLEATRNIKDANFANLTDGNHGVVQSGGIWTFSGTSDTTGIFTRVVNVSTVDSTRKLVSVTVTWSQGASTAQVTAATRFHNWTTSLSSWDNIANAGSLDLTGSQDGTKVATAGNYAYLVRNPGGAPNFFIIDVSNPAAPSLVSSLTLSGNPTDIVVSGNFAYVSNATDSAELQIVNITVPAAPVLLTSFNATGNGDGQGLFFKDNLIYLARRSNSSNEELTIINVSTPATPTQVGTYNPGAFDVNAVYVSGTKAYLATAQDTTELMVVDVTTPGSTSLLGSFNLTGNVDANAVVVTGTTVFLAQGTSITSVNASNPASMSQLGTLTLSGSGIANDIDLDNTATFLFVASANTSAEFRVINVSNPSSLTLATTVNLSGSGSNELNGIVYSSSLDIVIGAAGLDNKELVTFTKN